MATKTGAENASEVQVLRLWRPEDISQCAELYQTNFVHAEEREAVNVRLLMAIAVNGGVVVGAQLADRLVGFAFSFLARTEVGHRLYHYSQTAVVDAAWRGLGIGRTLKLAQREAALEQQIDTMRWLFDPLNVINAHFNLDVLGGLGVELKPNAYGAARTAADGDDPTDRLLIEWQLDSARVAGRIDRRARHPMPAALDRMKPGKIVSVGRDVWLAVPSDRDLTRVTGDHGGLRAQILEEIGKLLRNGFVASSCVRLDDRLAVYRFSAEVDDCRRR